MKVENIKEFIPSFELRSPDNSVHDFIVDGICDKHTMTAHKVFFCGDKYFWKEICGSKEKDIFIIFAKKFFEGVPEDERNDVLAKFVGWAIVDNVPLAISCLSKPFYEQRCLELNDEVDGRQLGTAQIHPEAHVGQNVFIGNNVTIGKGSVVLPGSVILSQSTIGENTTLYPNVSVMPWTKIGSDCRIHSGTVIGSDGFGYNFDEGVHHKVWHMGGVEIGDDVEIGSNSSIDQGTFSPTQIGNGVKIDNLVQIAHNSHIKNGVVICGQAGVAGSASLGEFTVVGGGARIAPDCHVGKACQVGGAAGVTTSLEDGAVVAGFPARPIKEWLRGLAAVRKLALKK